MGNSDLATIALYLDRQKERVAQTHPGSREWHYDNRPVCDANLRRSAYCPAGNCASVQINRHYRTLLDAHSTLDQRRFAIQVLVHLIGDVHQPLHASDHEDRGGNDVSVRFLLQGGARRSTNLHSAWDTDFVKAAFTSADERKIAQDLLAGADGSAIQSWQHGSASAWLAESYAISADFAYKDLPGFSCAIGNGDIGPIDLGEDYVARATAAIPRQLLKAGARIAYVLNRAFRP